MSPRSMEVGGSVQVVGRASASAQGSPGLPSSEGAALDAVERFKRACVRLAFFGSKDAGAWTLDGLCSDTGTASEIEAGQALADLALDQCATRRSEELLAALLRPDPDREAAAWTVACYRVGDLVPHALRDYTVAADAVRELVGCGEPAHVAAELVASGGDDVWWTGLVRTGSQVRFQLPGPASVTGGGAHASSHEHATDAEAARARWAVQLASWCTSQCATWMCADAHARRLEGDRSVRAGDEGDEARVGTAPPGEASIDDVLAAVRELTGVVATIAEAVDRLERQVGTLECQMTAPTALLVAPSAEGRGDADLPGVAAGDADLPGLAAGDADLPGLAAGDADLPGVAAGDADLPGVAAGDADQWIVEQFGSEPVEAADEPLHRWWPARRPHPGRRPVPGPGRTTSGLP